MRTIKTFCIALGLCIGGPVAAEIHDDQTALIAFLAPLGCAIGPSTRQAAIDAGFAPEVIDVVSGIGNPVRDWRVLPPDICKITLPQIKSPVSLTDPDVMTTISAIDAYAEFDEPGCFLDGDLLQKVIQRRYGWDADQTNTAYLQFLAAGIIDGSLRFYSESALRTPVGFQIMIGACGKVPNASAVRINHSLIALIFDDFLRANASDVACETGAWMTGVDAPGILDRLTDGRNTNAWLAFEIQMIVMGAGWFEGMNPTNRGTPRPPLCQ